MTVPIDLDDLHDDWRVVEQAYCDPVTCDLAEAIDALERPNRLLHDEDGVTYDRETHQKILLASVLLHDAVESRVDDLSREFSGGLEA